MLARKYRIITFALTFGMLPSALLSLLGSVKGPRIAFTMATALRKQQQ